MERAAAGDVTTRQGRHNGSKQTAFTGGFLRAYWSETAKINTGSCFPVFHAAWGLLLSWEISFSPGVGGYDPARRVRCLEDHKEEGPQKTVPSPTTDSPSALLKKATKAEDILRPFFRRKNNKLHYHKLSLDKYKHWRKYNTTWLKSLSVCGLGPQELLGQFSLFFSG